MECKRDSTFMFLVSCDQNLLLSLRLRLGTPKFGTLLASNITYCKWLKCDLIQWPPPILRYGSEIITWSTETIETGWLEEGSNGVKYTQSPKLPTGTFLHLDLNVTSMLGDNFISGHRDFHVNLTRLSMGPRPTRVKSWSLIELDTNLPYQHKSYVKFRTF